MTLSKLSKADIVGKDIVERLGLAWVRLNCYEWDEILGKKPDDFDGMTSRERYYSGVITGKMREIEDLLGRNSSAVTSWCWWKYELNRTFDEWVNWYLYSEDID